MREVNAGESTPSSGVKDLQQVLTKDESARGGMAFSKTKNLESPCGMS